MKPKWDFFNAYMSFFFKWVSDQGFQISLLFLKKGPFIYYVKSGNVAFTK